MNQGLIERLRKIGVYLHSGGLSYNPIMAFSAKIPLVAIWKESEEPTDQEISQLAEIVETMAGHYKPTAVHDFIVEGANMVTLRKVNGKWTFRRMTWEMGPTWFLQPGTLEEIAAKL